MRPIRGRHLHAPTSPGAIPVEVARVRLYTPEELYDTPAYADSLDARAYAWTRAGRDRDAATAQALHDNAIDAALAEWLTGRHVVGVMGGHSEPRGSAAYASGARLGRLLGATHTVATGGGPGLMEAVNLGARLADSPTAVLEEAVATLAAVPSFEPSVDAWVEVARKVVAATGSGRDSLGIPTWFYGHEPPNLFATAVAKYFRNALREAILLQICDAGIVFLPGLAGTVQEVFQDACENFYADEEHVAPMVLVGRRYWTETLPVWPLLRSLARGKVMEPHVHLVDTIEDAASLLAR